MTNDRIVTGKELQDAVDSIFEIYLKNKERSVLSKNVPLRTKFDPSFSDDEFVQRLMEIEE